MPFPFRYWLGCRRWMWTAIAIVGISGCDSFSLEQGTTRGSVGRRGLNGLGGFRKRLIEPPVNDVGKSFRVQTRDITVLSPRTEPSQVLVMIPRIETGLNADTRRWFERWFERGGRTLVYVLPDAGSLEDYLRTVPPTDDPVQRLVHRRRVAELVVRRLDRASGKTASAGPWATVVTNAKRIPVRLDDDNASTDGAADTLAQEATDRGTGNGNSGNGATFDRLTVDRLTVDQFLQPPTGDPSDRDAASSGGDDPPPMQALVTAGGKTVVAEVDVGDRSRVIVVAAGSLLTNYALSTPAGSAAADRVVAAVWRLSQDQSQDQSRDETSPADEPIIVAFAETQTSNPTVRHRPSDPPIAGAAAVFTTWPLSLVTIHALVAGLVGCLVLLPTFGRPRRAIPGDPSRMGDHVTAVASLLALTPNEPFAQRRIRRYRQRIRGELDPSSHP